MSKTLALGGRLRYPITIVKLLKNTGDSIKKQEPLMQYSFKWKKEVGDHIRDETWEEEQTTIATWDSPVDGEILRWQVKEGESFYQDRTCLVVKEACTHEIQFQGLCAMCGKDMTEVNWVSDARDTERAPINMVHDQTNLTVSATQAQRAELELQDRLLKQRKLSLVVDLDQTIIHACIEPTIGEWQKDPSNPNYDSVKEVRTFQLNDDGPRGLASGCNYYIKMRPGLERFLSRVAHLYELHVYTMGTRAYALNIAEIVDKDKKFFGNRVISRNENGSLTAKSLQRLFPSSTNMVVIIDDRADVWPHNRPNLIKVNPYDFFKGIGDINSSFLPKREDMLPPSPPLDKTVKTDGGSGVSDEKKVSALEGLVNMSGGEQVTKKQMEEQERTLAKQIEDRPLLHMQEKLDKEDEAEKAVESQNGGGNHQPSLPNPQRHQLLFDDDHELEYLEKHLTELHEAYYEEYDRNQSGEASDLSGSPSVPDVGTVLDSLKARILSGTKLVLSGIIPLDVDVMRSELGLQLMSFGAEILQHVRKGVTHVVVNTARPRTQKAIKAAGIPGIKIVNQDWLTGCLTQWSKVDEAPYLVRVDPDSSSTKNSDLSAETTDADEISDADDSDEDVAKVATQARRLKNPKLRIISELGRARDIDDESGTDNEMDENLLPSHIAEGQLSPVDGLGSFNWGAADEELNEFLAGLDDDEDEEEGGGEIGEDEDEAVNDEEDDETDGRTRARSRSRSQSRKRKLGEEEEEEEVSDASRNNSPKKQRLSRARGSSKLRAQYNSDADSSLPTPQVTGDEEEVQLGNGTIEKQERDDVADALEADLFAEFEAAGVEQEKG
ncbi:hypothetical protein GQ53DRAFT_357516 [Thozetella sp. PMI_491]|nr:hypothetical protein GQ53DRAFT_357516 [Thozetella sp. PMI_491]